MPKRRDEIREQNFVVALYYLFLRANQPTNAQCQTVIACLGDLRDGETVVIDYEKDRTLPPIVQRDAAAAIFEARYHRGTLIYENLATIITNPTHRKVWLAKYGGPEPKTPHLLWQYTDRGGPWAGAGYCDTSVYHGTATQLRNELQSIAPTKAQETDMSTELTIVYANGAKRIGTPDGAILDAGTTSYGSFYSLTESERQVLTTPLTNFFALTPVNVNDEAAGSVAWVLGTDNGVHQFRFDAEFLASRK